MDMTNLTARANKLIDALSESIMTAAEVAAERVQMASEVARIQSRMASFGAVLESIAAQKQPLLEKMATATGPIKAMYGKQVEMLTIQETAVLRQCGVSDDIAAKAVETADAGQPTHKRAGRKFERVTHVNGQADN